VSKVQFRVLGPLEIVDGERVIRLPRGKERALLVLLLLNANKVVSRDRLIDALWGEQPPDTAPTALHGLVSQLRRHLGSDADEDRQSIVVTRPPGYLLQIAEEELDVGVFERLVEQGQDALSNGSPEDAADALREALALWRGPALDGLAYEDFAQADAARLEEERMAATEDRIEADLAVGRHHQLASELSELVAQNPFRERLRAQLMLALYRCGRQVDALHIYRVGHELARRELGIEPGPRLRDLEQAILRQDPAIGPPPRAWLTPRRMQWRVVLAGTVVVAAAGVAALVAFGGRDTPRTVAVVPHSVAVVDVAKNTVVADIRVGGYPGPVAVGAGSVWVGNIGDATISRINAGMRRVVGINGLARALDLALDGRRLWVAAGGAPGHATTPPGTVLQFDLASAKTRTVRVGPQLVGDEEQTTIAVGRDALWAGNKDSGTVRKIDLASGDTLATIEGIVPGGIGVGPSGVWVSDLRANRVVRIDPSTNRITTSVAVRGGPTRLAVGRRAVWVTTRGSRAALWRIDPGTNEVAATIPLRGTPARVALGAGSVWVSSFHWARGRSAAFGGLLSRIDPTTNRVMAEIPLGQRTDGLAVTNEFVWVAVGPKK
jgi:DNA-binding SARP family transcriptional activator/streptogramin lyase